MNKPIVTGVLSYLKPMTERQWTSSLPRRLEARETDKAIRE